MNKQRTTTSSGVAGRLLSGCVAALFMLGVVLMCVNLYGLTQSVRKPDLGLGSPEELRFASEVVWSYEQSMQSIAALGGLQDRDEVVRQAVKLVNKSLVHPDWFRVDPVEYRQLIPVWHNYFLHVIGRFSGLPQFERYHFADYRRSIRRGIGMCGDASTVLSSVLDNLGVENRIVSFDGHVIVEYQAANDEWYLADPDFGVLLGSNLQQLAASPQSARNDYLSAGYSQREANSLARIYSSPYTVFDSVYDFMTLRFIFEYASYFLKWLLPVLLVVLGILFFRAQQRLGTGK